MPRCAECGKLHGCLVGVRGPSVGVDRSAVSRETHEEMVLASPMGGIGAAVVERKARRATILCGCRRLAAGCCLLAAGYCVPGGGCSVLVFGVRCRVLVSLLIPTAVPPSLRC